MSAVSSSPLSHSSPNKFTLTDFLLHLSPSDHLSSQPSPLQLRDCTPHLTVEKHHCYKACWSWPEPANEAAVQPSLSTTIWLMSCQSLPRGRPSPKPRGDQSLLAWTLNYSLLLKPWAQVTAFLGTRHFVWEWLSVLVKKGEDCGIRPLQDNLLLRSARYILTFKDSAVH